MKRILSGILPVLALAIATTGCQNKELGELDNTMMSVDVRIIWENGNPVRQSDGMRINLFSMTAGIPHYGMADVPYTGAPALLYMGCCYRTFAYTYQGNNLYFRNQLDPERIEAYCAPMTRGTYTRAFPDEATITEATGEFYVGENEAYTVLPKDRGQHIDGYPENKLYTYTFEIRGIEGVEFISDTRGAISGMSSSYFLTSRTLSAAPSTVLFNASADVATGCITGSFRTFGRLDTANRFTIEILYPSSSGGIAQYSWDVTNQIGDGLTYHIVIDGSDIAIPDEGGTSASGWEIDVAEWEDVTVPLN